MIRWLARYEVTVHGPDGPESFRFTSRSHARWALWFGEGVLAETNVKVTIRDRWTGRSVTA